MRFKTLVTLVVLVFIDPVLADSGIPAITLTEQNDGSKEYSVTLQILVLMTMLTFLPAIIMMMTSFMRITIVLAILRQAIGLQQTPSNQILIGISLFLTLFIMTPVLDEVYANAVKPYMDEKITAQQAVAETIKPFRGFMFEQTRTNDLELFLQLANHKKVDSENDIPLAVLVPAFITSELKTAFQIGFMLFIPFLVIDMVIASMLMAMGMMMLSPLIISLPFKIMLFVLIDGWTLVIGTLAASFGL
ncbi:MAG: flagellar type III secretion system pore protein FliP [Pseudomonadota bacterium]